MSVDAQFWRKRWQSGQIGFHEAHGNADLHSLWPQLQCPPGAAVFVPLCGKSLDMAWLHAQGHPVIGIELAELAIASFFEEQRLAPVRESIGPLQRWRAPGYELYVGDFFALQAEALAAVQAVYDRAALIALPAPLRERYARRLALTLPPGCKVLLLTLDYPQEQMAGPPFAVAEAEVRALFGRDFSVRHLASRDALAEEPRFVARGLQALRAQAYLLVHSGRP